MLKNYRDTVSRNLTLDPENWTEMRALGHQMIDDIMDHLEQSGNNQAGELCLMKQSGF